jgi:hypothetical protein
MVSFIIHHSVKNMSFLGDLGSDEPNDGVQETILEKVVFYKVKDSECGSIIWRHREEKYGIQTVSNRGFDTLAEAVEDYLSGFEEEN